MSILSGLEAFGFKDDNRKVYEDVPVQSKKEAVQKEKKEAVVKEEEFLFPKSHECPVCGEKFKMLAVKSGRAHSIGQDDDLRPRYQGIDPIKYDALVCPKCGYGAVARYFDHVMPTQGKKLRQEVMPSFSGIDLSGDKYSYETALTHYKLVLMCDVVGGVSNSRKAYTCLKMAWVIRGWLENEGNQMSREERNCLEADEKECIQNAYDGYMKAFSTETFPMSGMDEITLSYLLAELAYSLGQYREALQMLVNVIGNRNVSARIKDKALMLKEQIREKTKQG